MKHWIFVVLSLSILFTFNFNLSAQELTALEILEKSDEVGTAPRDQHQLSTMILIDKWWKMPG